MPEENTPEDDGFAPAAAGEENTAAADQAEESAADAGDAENPAAAADAGTFSGEDPGRGGTDESAPESAPGDCEKPETAEGDEPAAETPETEDDPEATAGDGSAEEDPDTEDGGENGDAPEEPAFPLASVVEAVLFAAREPLKLQHLARAAGKRIRQEAVRDAISELNVHYLETGRAFEIAEISGRYQLMSRPEYVSHIMKIYPKKELTEKDRAARLTPAALDTLAIIAYRQPVTRADIEHIRGVGCGPVLRALMERGSVRVAGKRTDLVGQPLMYGTTEAFLAEFGLGSLDELPLRSEFLGMLGDAEPAAFEPVPEPDTPPEPAAESDAEAETVPEAEESASETDIPSSQDQPASLDTESADAAEEEPAGFTGTGEAAGAEEPAGETRPAAEADESAAGPEGDALPAEES